MSSRAEDLAERLGKFNQEVIAFVEKCSDQDWRKMSPAEQWPVGVTARHIGAGHYEVVSFAGKVLAGEQWPNFTGEQIVDMANQHAREHADCTRREVIEVLEKNGSGIVEFVRGLKDSELDFSSYLPSMGRDVTVEKFIEMVVLVSGKEHFENVKAAVGK